MYKYIGGSKTDSFTVEHNDNCMITVVFAVFLNCQSNIFLQGLVSISVER